ncbi:MAG: hypothetical protein AB7P34_11470 [Vicinamibacterales bacterium]
MTANVMELVQVVADAARNLYGAGGGSVHQSAYAAALGGLAWTWAYEEALRAGQHVSDHGGDETLIEEAFRESFAESLGWSDQEFEQFWNDPSNDFHASDPQRYDETRDAWEAMTKRR